MVNRFWFIGLFFPVCLCGADEVDWESDAEMETIPDTYGPPLKEIIASEKQTKQHDQPKPLGAAPEKSTLSRQDLTTFERTSMLIELPYQVTFTKPLEPGVMRAFTAQSTLLKEKNKVVSCRAVAEQKAARDREILQELCIKEGYFDVLITYALRLQMTGLGIEFRVELGPRYRLVSKQLKVSGANLQRSPTFLTVQNPDYVDFQEILADKHRLLKHYQNEGYYFATVSDPEIQLDHAKKIASVTYTVLPAQPAQISKILVRGNGDIPEFFVLRRSALHKGRLLKAVDIEEAQENLLEAGLFSSVKIETKPEGKQQATVQPATVNINVQPLPPRVLGFGAYFSASEGFLVTGLWQHQNAFKKAWEAGLSGRVGMKEVSARATLNIPDIWRPCQKLHNEIALIHMNTPAYEGNKIAATVGLMQDFRVNQTRFQLSVLPTFERGLVVRDYGLHSCLWSLPVVFGVNRTNHRFTPTSGVAFEMKLSPHFGSFATNDASRATLGKDKKPSIQDTCLASMTVLEGTVKMYVSRHPHSESCNQTGLAALLSAGSILIRDPHFIPFDKRFYGGGRNSMRSYGYQLCSHLDENDAPIGGVSIVEACLEPRIRLTENVGLVTFCEVCRTSESPWPMAGEKTTTLVGGGIGIRYFTRFGPIRFDIGIPFIRRAKHATPNKKVDRALQFYISVGQCF